MRFCRHRWYLWVWLLLVIGVGTPGDPVHACSPTSTPLLHVSTSTAPILPPTPKPHTRYRAMINQAETILLGSIQATTPGHLTLRVEKEYFQYTPTAHVMVSFPADTCADISLEHGTRVLIFARADASPDTATIDLQYLRLDEAILVIHGDTVTSALRNIPYGSLAAIETEIARDSRAKSQTSNTVPPKLAEAQTVSPTMPTSSVFTPAAKPWTTTTDENQHRRIWGIIGILAVGASILYLLHSRRRERVKR